MRSYEIEVWGKMWTLNAERKMHHFTRAKNVKDWREAAATVAIAKNIPHLEAIEVTFTPHRVNKSGLADLGGHFPVLKACIDGLMDAGVIDEDGPEIVKRLVFEAPIVTGDSKALIHIKEIKK
jgi:crossover junction endodeoxyribonuclease RusA